MTIVGATDINDADTKSVDANTITGTDTVTTDDINILEEKDKTFNYNDNNSISKTKSVSKQDTTTKDVKKATTTTVASYTELWNKVNEAMSSSEEVYTISLQPGDYNTTDKMFWNTPKVSLIDDTTGATLETTNSLTINKGQTKIEVNPIDNAQYQSYVSITENYLIWII